MADKIIGLVTFNINPPSATYYWSPSVSNSFAYPYEGHYLYSPVMNVESETNVIVRFQIALDGYQITNRALQWYEH